jgi:hypothetical protein
VNTYYIRLEFGSIIADSLSVTLGSVALSVHIICDPVLTPRAVLATLIVGLMVALTTASLLTFVLELYAVQLLALDDLHLLWNAQRTLDSNIVNRQFGLCSFARNVKNFCRMLTDSWETT